MYVYRYLIHAFIIYFIQSHITFHDIFHILRNLTYQHIKIFEKRLIKKQTLITNSYQRLIHHSLPKQKFSQPINRGIPWTTTEKKSGKKNVWKSAWTRHRMSDRLEIHSYSVSFNRSPIGSVALRYEAFNIRAATVGLVRMRETTRFYRPPCEGHKALRANTSNIPIQICIEPIMCQHFSSARVEGSGARWRWEGPLSSGWLEVRDCLMGKGAEVLWKISEVSVWFFSGGVELIGFSRRGNVRNRNSFFT